MSPTRAAQPGTTAPGIGSQQSGGPGSPWQRYALAALVTVASVALYWALAPDDADAPAVIVFVIPIILSAYIGGLGPGLLSTVLALLGTYWWLRAATDSAHAETNVVRWLTLLPVGVLISVLNEALHRARRRAEAARDARLESEERFRRERALLRALIDSIPDLIFFKDRHSVYLGCNKAFEVYSGVAEDALIGKTDLELTAPEVAQMYRRADRDMLASGQVWRGEEWIPFHDGGGGYFDTLKTPYFGPEGDVLGLIGVSRNVTERKQVEERLRLQAAALEAAANGIVIADRSGAILWVNAAFTRLTGYEAAEVIGENPRILKSGQQGEGFYAQLWDTITTGEVWHGEIVNRRKDGSVYTEEMTITPVRATGGEISHFVAIKQDVTDRLRSEEGRMQLEAQLHSLQKLEALGTLAGGVAHDFNNILGAIIGNVELAAQDVEPHNPALASLDEIRKASRRAAALVQRILAFSRQQPKSLRVIPLEPVVEDTVNLLRATLPAGVELRTCCDPVPKVLADATQMEQVLLNLCTNAWQAIDGSVGRIDIALDTVSGGEAGAHPNLRPGQWARLTVKDSGTGMDRATVARVFEPFFTTKPPGRGTGLGLSVVHGIVTAHGGAIEVDSEPGKGSTFRVYLPAATATAGADASAAQVAPQRPSRRGQHVLFLDDEEPLVYLATRTLERLGYRVSGFTNAAEALEAVAANADAFDLVVTDLSMPGMTGLDVAREVRRRRPDLPVVLASGYITGELEAQAKRAGVLELIYKPNTVEELCAVVRRHAEATTRQEQGQREDGTHPDH